MKIEHAGPLPPPPPPFRPVTITVETADEALALIAVLGPADPIVAVEYVRKEYAHTIGRHAVSTAHVAAYNELLSAVGAVGFLPSWKRRA